MAGGSIEIPELEGTLGKWGLMTTETHVKMLVTLEAAAITMQSLAKQQAPVRTGKLRSSISYKIDDGVSMKATVAPNAKYGGIIEFGRGEVTPSNAKVLATKINPGWGSANGSGYYIIGMRSKAVAPNPYMGRAYKYGKPIVIGMFEDMRNNIVKGLV
jgi:hypothetical protein